MAKKQKTRQVTPLYNGFMEQEELLLPWEEEKDTPEPEPEEVILTVSQVNRMARQRLEEITLSVQGEVSRLTTGYAYYVYFDLRDEGAALPAMLTQKQLSELDFKLEDGALVVVRGTLTPVSYTHLRAHETRHDLVCRLLLEKKKTKYQKKKHTKNYTTKEEELNNTHRTL